MILGLILVMLCLSLIFNGCEAYYENGFPSHSIKYTIIWSAFLLVWLLVII